jgi:hypothetical protein
MMIGLTVVETRVHKGAILAPTRVVGNNRGKTSTSPTQGSTLTKTKGTEIPLRNQGMTDRLPTLKQT